MRSLTKSELLAAKGRPKRRAAKTHFFKYQLAGNPSRAEDIELKKALQESLKEPQYQPNHRSKIPDSIINSSTNSSDVSRSTNSSSSNESARSNMRSSTPKRTRSTTSLLNGSSNKRAKLDVVSEHHQTKCDDKSRVSIDSPTVLPHINKAIKTYSRSQPITANVEKKQELCTNGLKSSSSSNTSQSTRTTTSSPQEIPQASREKSKPQSQTSELQPIKDEPDQYLKFKRESKNYAYVKMTALKVNSQKSFSSNSKSSNSKKSSLNRTGTSKSPSDVQSEGHESFNNCILEQTVDLSNKSQNQVDIRVTKRRAPQGSWSLIGIPEEKVIYLRDDEPPRRLICYPAIKHIEGDVIQVRDSVLLRSGAKKTDLPYIAKVCSFWADAETGSVMMSLFWYYRPEHTEEKRKPHHLTDEIFASRHRDVDSVECIEDKCYVLTFNEYCRYRKRCKMEQVNTTWSLTDVTIPVSNESYPRRNRIPDSDVNRELVFCCRQIYDSRLRRLMKNPHINSKYGNI